MSQTPTSLFKKQNILPLRYSINSKLAKFMWNLYNEELPDTIASNFRSNSRIFISYQKFTLILMAVTQALGVALFISCCNPDVSFVVLKGFPDSARVHLQNHLFLNQQPNCLLYIFIEHQVKRFSISSFRFIFLPISKYNSFNSQIFQNHIYGILEHSLLNIQYLVVYAWG